MTRRSTPTASHAAAAGVAPASSLPREKRKPGRPPIHTEAWTKVTVVLFDRQIAFLDRLAANIRGKSGAVISRAQLIRSLVDAVAAADVDLTAAVSEADLKSTLLSRLGQAASPA